MSTITDRQETILALVVREYTETTQPIGSKRLIDRYSLGVSSATVRNEMAALTDSGYLRQPYTSAGRIPTEAGYRYFVRRLLGETELPIAEKRMISHQFHQAPTDMDEWLRLSASILAQHSRVASLVTTPRPDRAFFKHLELISIKDRQVLLVLVLQGGDVRQQMLALSDVWDQAKLAMTAAEITTLCAGMDAQDIQLQSERKSDLLQDISRLVAEMMARADEVWTGEIYRDGLANVLAQPEFAGSEAARPALRLLEERGFLDEVLAHILSPNINGVQVMIGGEGEWEELRDCSMVLTRYGAPGFAIGALGVLGPTRMAYGRTISTVRYVAGLLSELVIETFAE
ncbi:MAG: heat-inducible transcriptional repressor HrcA [Anaerolineales bacterium]|nr:heat-inducible transcriptional repressor HrcA [Anaerolineales bacterium]